MNEKVNQIDVKNNRRALGVHLTSVDIFQEYIFPEIKNKLKEYLWVDLYCGEGNLILPILDAIPEKERIEFFEKHIYLFDIQEEMVQKSIKNAENYGIPC
ncbi:MAG: N-6 DNA methylase, partial [Candidatus Heimdallarchaeaceae archaeon]